MDKSRSNLKVRAPTVQELETFQQRPFVLAHDVAGQSTSCATLTADGMHKDRLSRLEGLLNKFKDGVRSLIFWIPGVKQNLKGNTSRNV